MIEIIKLTSDELRVFQDAIQLQEIMDSVERQGESYRGGMVWKTINGAEYLVKTLDRHGHQKSLGRRTPETEAVQASFVNGKRAIEERMSALKTRQEEYRRFLKAVRLNHIPVTLARILRRISHATIGNRVCMIGTNCMAVYGTMYGVKFFEEVLATNDVDILHDARPNAILVIDTLEKIIEAVKSSDSTFEIDNAFPYRLVNKRGYLVDCVTSIARINEPPKFKGSLRPAEIAGLEWLIASPKVTHYVIDTTHRLVIATVPCASAFAAHKLWLTEQPTRSHLKKRRDFLQATTLMTLFAQLNIKDHENELMSFPSEIRDAFLMKASHIRAENGDRGEVS